MPHWYANCTGPNARRSGLPDTEADHEDQHRQSTCPEGPVPDPGEDLTECSGQLGRCPGHALYVGGHDKLNEEHRGEHSEKCSEDYLDGDAGEVGHSRTDGTRPAASTRERLGTPWGQSPHRPRVGRRFDRYDRFAARPACLQYRPLLGELTEARQFPIDPFPEVTVLGRIDERDLSELRSLAEQGFVDDLSRAAAESAKTDRTIVHEPPVRTGSTITAHEEAPVHYLPIAGRWLEDGRLIHEEHPSAAYAVAGLWKLRLGPPIGLTPSGLLVFQPIGMDGARVTIEHPVSQPIGPRTTEARVGIYRHDGLGGWHQTATVHCLEELRWATESRPLRPEQVGLRSPVV